MTSLCLLQLLGQIEDHDVFDLALTLGVLLLRPALRSLTRTPFDFDDQMLDLLAEGLLCPLQLLEIFILDIYVGFL